MWTRITPNTETFYAVTALHILKNSLKLKGTFMQIEKAWINDRLRVSKVMWKFRIPTIYNFAVVYL